MSYQCHVGTAWVMGSLRTTDFRGCWGHPNQMGRSGVRNSTRQAGKGGERCQGLPVLRAEPGCSGPGRLTHSGDSGTVWLLFVFGCGNRSQTSPVPWFSDGSYGLSVTPGRTQPGLIRSLCWATLRHGV